MNKILALIIIVIFNFNLLASVEERTNIQTTTDAVNIFNSSTPAGSTFEVRSEYFNLSSGYFFDQSSKIDIKLQLENPGIFHNNTSTTPIFSVPLKIELFNFNNTTNTPDKTYFTTLELKYNTPTETNMNQMISSFHTEGYYKIKVTRTGSQILNPFGAVIKMITTLSVNRSFMNDRVYADFTYSRNTSFDPTKTYFENQKGDALKLILETKYKSIAIPYSGISDPKKINFDETDIEWAFVDFNSPKGNLITNNNNLSITNFTSLFDGLTFSRVSLPNLVQTFEIPMLYSQGYIVVRTRPVSYLGSKRIEGNWFYYDLNRNTGQSSIYFCSGHQNNLNWSSSLLFGEDAKTKENISYFDGTQRERQSVSTNNSTNIALITESFYDFEGRKAISTLPAPKLSNVSIQPISGNAFEKSIPSNTVKFYDGFSINSAGQTYKEANFNNQPSSGCSIIPTDPMSKLSGASQYYSDNNKLHITHPNVISNLKDDYLNKWVPNANNFPFVQSRYTTDGTNRLSIQSGLGADYKLGSGKEVEYFYTNVNNQEELKKLFGYNVGNKMYYTKTYTEDPNGQTSVSYHDANDKTIATALVGEVPSNLEPISSYKPLPDLTYDTFIETNRMIKDTIEGTLIGNSIHYNPLNNQTMSFKIDFDHIVATDDYNTPICNTNQTYCADCFYDIDFSVKEKCGSIVPGSVKTLKNYDVNTIIDKNCNNNSPTPLPSILEIFDLTGLNKGEYDINATVKVSTIHADLYTKNYIEEIKKCSEFSLESFITKNVNLIDEYDCITTCTKCNELYDNGSAAAKLKYRAKIAKLFKPNSITTTELDNLVNLMFPKLGERCQEMCSGNYTVGCNVYKNNLLKDISKGGQYWFQIDPVTGLVDLTSTTINNNPVVALAMLNNPNPKLRDANGNMYTKIEDIVKDWKIEWAEELLKFHPEYCYYEKCISMEKANKVFDDKLKAATVYNHSIVTNNSFITNEYMYETTPVSFNPPPSNPPTLNTDLINYIFESNNFRFFATSGTQRSLKEYAFMMAFASYPNFSWAGTGMHTPNHFFTSNNYTYYCAEDLALYWTMYKKMVTSFREVMKFKNMEPKGQCPPTTVTSINTYCCPNQYISCGAGSGVNQNSNVSIKILNKNLFDGFITSPICNGNPLDDVMKFNNHTYTKSHFNSKKRNFPDLKSTMTDFISKINSIVAGSSVTVTSPAITAEQLNAKKEQCKTLSKGWIDNLDQCIKTKLGLSPTQILELRENLEKVCQKHCGESPNWFGTKTIDPDPNVLGVDIKIGTNQYTVKSFQEILDLYRGTSVADPYCTADLVSMPKFGTGKSYDQPEQREIFAPKKGTCECDMLANWKQKWQVANSGKTFYNYMKDNDNTFNITLSELAILESGCNGTTPICRYLGENFILPKAFMCVKYYTCYDIVILKNEFNKKYSNINWTYYPEKTKQDALTGFFNTYKGMNLNYDDYKSFFDQCENCVANDFVEKRTLYQGIYDDFTNIPANVNFPNWEQDNLRKLAAYYNTRLGSTDITTFKMIEILCKYLIKTNNKIPCCVSEHYYSFINAHPIKANESEFSYYNYMKSYINAVGGYSLSLNDFKNILKYCAGIEIGTSYKCCDLDVKWREYTALYKNNINALKGKSRVEYLNLVLGQEKTLAEFTTEYDNCKANNNAGITNCSDIYNPNSPCPTYYKAVMDAYIAYLSANISFEINWSAIDITLLSFINTTAATNLTGQNFKDLYNNIKCDRTSFDKKLACLYFGKWKTANFFNPNVPISQLPNLFQYLNSKVGYKDNISWINLLSTCSGANFCDNFKLIYFKYKKFLNLPANAPSYIINWTNTASWTSPTGFITFINNPLISPPIPGPAITAADFNYIIDNFRSPCVFDECTELNYFFMRFKALNGITSNYIPPSQLNNMLAYLSNFMKKTYTLQDLSCLNINFCDMYQPIYSGYMDYLTKNKSFVTNWNNTSTWNSPTGLLTHINTYTNKTISVADLKYVFFIQRGCYITECNELDFYFDRYLLSKGINLNTITFTHFHEFIANLNLLLDKNESSTYWTKKLKDCQVFDVCTIYNNIFNAYILYHQNNPNFEIDWTNVDGSLISFIESETGNTSLLGEQVLDAFNNTECHDKFNCILLKHYYDQYQNTHGMLLTNPNSSLFELIHYLNEKFNETLSFNQWIAILKKCSDINISDQIASCDQIRSCILDLLVDFETLTKENLINMDPSVMDNPHLANLNNCVGKQYIREDWMLILSLCNFNDDCFDLELFKRRYFKNGQHSPQLNECNLENYNKEYALFKGQVYNKDFSCFDLNIYQLCPQASPFGIENINCGSLQEKLEFFICNTDPSSFLIMDPSTHLETFNKGLYLEQLRSTLNIDFGVTLSICDYEMLLESCAPCCLGNFFEYLNFSYVYYYFNKSNYNAQNNIAWFTIMSTPYGRNSNSSFDCSSPGLFCSKMYQYYGTPWIPNSIGLYPFEVNILNTNNNKVLEDLRGSDGLDIVFFTGTCSGSCYSEEDDNSGPGEGKKPCDKSICDQLVPSYIGVNDEASGNGVDKNVDFDTWWEYVYNGVVHDMFSSPFPSKEELKLMLYCCGINIHDNTVNCGMLHQWINDFIAALDGLRRTYPGLSDAELFKIFMNAASGLDETAANWMTMAEDFCNFDLPFGEDVLNENFPCDRLMTAFEDDKHLESFWPTGTDVYSKVRELMIESGFNLNMDGFFKQIMKCLDCEKFIHLMKTNKVFNSIINSRYYGESGMSYKDKIEGYLRSLNCEYTPDLIDEIYDAVVDLYSPQRNSGLRESVSRPFDLTSAPKFGLTSTSYNSFSSNSIKFKTTRSSFNTTNTKLKLQTNSRNITNKPLNPIARPLTSTSAGARMPSPSSRPITKSTEGMTMISPEVKPDANVEGNEIIPFGINGFDATDAGTCLVDLNLGIDFNKYTCCKFCDKKLYDKAAFSIPPKDQDPCDYLMGQAITKGIEEYNKFMQAKADEFRKKYIKKCTENARLKVTATSNDRKHHFTLYYYDQVGNLIQTVPPAGVRFFDPAITSGPNPPHKLETKYWYNMDNQLTRQESPDAGKAIFIYDELGRLILSQNAKQYPKTFSYTIYDKIGRISESGEITDNIYTSIPHPNVLYQTTQLTLGGVTEFRNEYEANNPHQLNYCKFEQLMRYYRSRPTGVDYRYVMRTYYDRLPAFTLPPAMAGQVLENIHNRIAFTTLDPADNDKNATTYRSALYYSYDIMGNVKKLYTFNNIAPTDDEAVKTVDYNYDLQSGKVNKVYYQKDKKDQFIHKYGYDAENRLTDVHTSFDDRSFNREARYTYYLHGPLARTEMGERKVQGLDYVYTLQGWLKSVNGSTISNTTEPGRDGIPDDFSIINCQIGNPLPAAINAQPKFKGVARDAVAFSLDYNQNDYQSITGSNGNIAAQLSGKNLYNGNIVSMKVTNKRLENSGLNQPATMGFSYTYDQLHRLVAMDAFKGSTNTPTEDYKERISYDANGNILTYQRNKDNAPVLPAPPTLDDLTYKYYFINSAGQKVTGTPTPQDKLTNQLAQVKDALGIPVLGPGKDIGDQVAANNYVYDALGNLIEDKEEGVTISWTPTGKIDQIGINKGSNQKGITFDYSPLGQRILKRLNDQTGTTYTYYSRDASGNLMATYKRFWAFGSSAEPSYELSEYPVYGSSRLGVKNPKKFSFLQQSQQLWPPNDNQQIYPDDYFNVSTVNFEPTTSTVTGSNYDEEEYQEAGYNYSYLAGVSPYIFKTKARLVRQSSGMTQYEIPNHLGNVLATLKDEILYTKTCTGSGSNQCCVLERDPIVLSATDYYPFGMPMPNRTYSVGGMKKYRFGFNTQEKDDEVYGEGNLMSAEYWEYDSRIGRRWNVDPKFNAYESRYSVNGNNPIMYNDPNGDFKSKFFANLSRAFNKLKGKDVGDVYQSEDQNGKKGEFGYRNGNKHNFGGKKSSSRIDKVIDFAEKSKFTCESKAVFSIGIQGQYSRGLASVEAGIMTREFYEIKMDWTKMKLNSGYMEENKFHNFIQLKVKDPSETYQVGGKYDYTINYREGYEGVKFEENTGHHDFKVLFGPSSFGPKLKLVGDGLKVQTSSTALIEKKADNFFYGFDLGSSLRLILGLEVKQKIGFTY